MVSENRVKKFITNGVLAYAGKCDRSFYVRMYAAGL